MAKAATPRKKVARKRYTFEIGSKLLAELDKACKLHRLSRSRIVADALQSFCDSVEKEERRKA
ncbi:MAG: hypothetical protein FJW32_23150 [Acidobacteria bacterium]|nr:hypothetical protein [Acidobacteriota bacterium]